MDPAIKDIPLREFDLSLSAMRLMNMSRILQIEKSMRLHGQLQPVVARVHKGGCQIIDGFKRYVHKMIMESSISFTAYYQIIKSHY